MRTNVLLLLALILGGCTAKQNIVYRDVYKPVRCNEIMPIMPQNDGTFKSHKEIMKYYIQCKSIAKICTGESNASSN